MAPDPFAGPSNEPNPDRPRPEVMAGYAGECGACGREYDEGDLIRATTDGAGWEAVDHGHDPEESAPQDAVEVGRLPLPAPPPGVYAVDVPTDAELRAALASGHPEVEAGASLLLSMTMTERGVYIAQQQQTADGEGLYGDSPPDDRKAPEQFSCPECPKSFAPTKDRLVRTHKRLADGERCPGSRAVPLELSGQQAAAPSAPVQQPAPHRFSADPEAIAALERAVATSPQVAAIVDRIHNGQTGRVPLASGSLDTRSAFSGGLNPELAPEGVTAQPEVDPDTGVDLDTMAAVQFPELARGFVTAPVSTPALANPDVDRVALYTPRPAEPEPTAENGGREPVYGRYVLPNPKTGKGKTWRRATTFASQLDDTYNLDAWQKRHLVRGAGLAAAQDPNRLTMVAKLDVREDKQILNDLAEALMAESGVHLAAEQGTLVHTLTEGVDRASDPGESELAWREVPPHYAADVAAYTKALETYGLRVVPSLLERRTVVVEYGVAGTFDQVTEVVQLQDWSRREGLSVGDFLVTDKKTGSNMDYGTGTHGIQLWLYAHGINTSGVWDAFGNRWTTPVRVREDVGIIVHIPLEQGRCTLHALNLERGREGAVLVQQGYDRARLLRSQAMRFSRPIGTVTVPKTAPSAPPEAPVQHIPSTPAAPSQPDPMQVWRDRLEAVTDPQQAYAAYQDAKDAGMPADLLAGYQVALTGKLGFSDPAPSAPPAAVPVQDPMAPWYEKAEAVQSRQHADWLMKQAMDAGMPEAEQRELASHLGSWLASNTDTDSPAPIGLPAVQDPMAPWLERAARVETLDQAKAVYTDAVAAGMPDAPQKQLTDALDQRLKELATEAVPSPMSAGYWIPAAMQVTDEAGARSLYNQMMEFGVPEDVKAVIAQRLRDWLASQQQAAVMVDQYSPHADAPDWDTWARGVTTSAQASELFRAAQQAAGATEQRLAVLTATMQQALANQPPF
jgi:hypothetical protein